MRAFFIIPIAAAFLSMSACSSELEIVSSDVPPPVQSAFQAKYPGASDVEWDVEKQQGRLYFEAEFRHDGKSKEARFTPDGGFVKED